MLIFKLFFTRRRGLKTKSKLALFISIFAIFVLNTGGMAVYAAFTISLVRGVLITNADQPLDVRFALADQRIVGYDIASQWLSNITGFNVSDKTPKRGRTYSSLPRKLSSAPSWGCSGCLESLGPVA